MTRKQTTRELWQAQDRHPGDRWRFFRAVGEYVDAQRVLYPGSYVDVAASFVFPDVTYVDVDRRAAGFFADRAGVAQIVAAHEGSPVAPSISFIHADYTTDLDLPSESMDLLISLYAGLVSDTCTRYLRPGGFLLANSSHGDVALADLDPQYRLDAVVLSRAGGYRVSTTGLDGYLVPRRTSSVTVDSLRSSMRGVAYTKEAAAYLFRRVA